MVDGATIRLGHEDAEWVIRVGIQRARNARSRGRPEPDGTPRDAEQTDINSAGAERAFAAFLGVEWEPLVDASDRGRRSRDVGGYEVRYTPRVDGRLIIKTRDDDDAPFVLVTGRVPVYIVRGWLRRAGDAKVERFWFRGDGRPQWFVPQAELEPWERIAR
jgi:hypothetical protein